MIGAPDGIVYAGNLPDGTSSQTLSAPGHISDGSFVYNDGVTVPDPIYDPAIQTPSPKFIRHEWK